jgi:BirA family biotin operon repressor/biotin-[acetyl-CoA-carboxylase] ligase
MSNSLFIGKVYHRFDELTSTNDYALELIAATRNETESHAAKSKPPEGTVVRADSQSAGRGQIGSRWEAAPGLNLTFSVILYPNWLAVQDQFYLSMAVALALYDACATLDLPKMPMVKWPNDLYFENRKCAGILIQNSISGKHLQSAVVGIGLNINQKDFGPGLGNPTSLAIESGRTFDPDQVAEIMFVCLERRYLQLKSGRKKDIETDYLARMYRLGLPSKFVRTSNETGFEGVICGVADDGRLRIETAAGTELFGLKEIKILS